MIRRHRQTPRTVFKKCFLGNSVIQNDESCKFRLPYYGSYRVVKVISPVNCVIGSLHRSTTKHVHF